MLKSFTPEDHARAQIYEFNYAKQWMDEHIPGILSAIESNGTDAVCNVGEGNPNILKEFFENSPDVWYAFVDRVKDCTSCLEIASGPCGAISTWNWINGIRWVVDTLAEKYEAYQQETFGASVFGDEAMGVSFLDGGAENCSPLFPIDGFIFARNSLDHSQDPIAAIRNISNIASTGCLLLYWSEVRHPDPDEGHRDICETSEEALSLFTADGWKLIRPVHVDGVRGIEFGGVFEKCR